jgi:hypothetical protein
MKKRKKQVIAPLLRGMPYTPSVKTNILDTFRKFGYVPPSEMHSPASLIQQPPFQ